MGDVSLDMIWKRLEDLHAGQEVMRTELAAVSETVRAGTATLVGIQREARSLNDRFTVLIGAVDDHTHRLDRIDVRLDRIEKQLDLTHA